MAAKKTSAKKKTTKKKVATKASGKKIGAKKTAPKKNSTKKASANKTATQRPSANSKRPSTAKKSVSACKLEPNAITRGKLKAQSIANEISKVVRASNLDQISLRKKLRKVELVDGLTLELPYKLASEVESKRSAKTKMTIVCKGIESVKGKQDWVKKAAVKIAYWSMYQM